MRAWIALLLLPSLAFGQVYRWVDEQGHVHYGQQPQAADAKVVDIRPQVVERDAATQERERRSERFFQARREEQAQAAEAKRQQQAERVKACADLHSRLASVPEGRRYYQPAANGERRYYTDEELDAGRDYLRSQLSERCN